MLGERTSRYSPCGGADSPIDRIEIGRCIEQKRLAYVIEIEVDIICASGNEVVCCVQVTLINI